MTVLSWFSDMPMDLACRREYCEEDNKRKVRYVIPPSSIRIQPNGAEINVPVGSTVAWYSVRIKDSIARYGLTVDTTTSTVGPDTMVAVYRADGALLGVNDDRARNRSFTPEESLLSFAVVGNIHAGVYYIAVGLAVNYPFLPNFVSTSSNEVRGPVKLKVTYGPLPNRPAVATTISLDEIQVSITPEVIAANRFPVPVTIGGPTWFKVLISPLRSSLWIQTTNAAGDAVVDTRLGLFDANGQLIVSDVSAGNIGIGIDAGLYYLSVGLGGVLNFDGFGVTSSQVGAAVYMEIYLQS